MGHLYLELLGPLRASAQRGRAGYGRLEGFAIQLEEPSQTMRVCETGERRLRAVVHVF